MRIVKAAVVVGLLAASGAAWGGDALTITITNDTTRDISVTVVDMTIKPHPQPVTTQTINGFASVSIAVSSDDLGRGHVAWSAVSVDLAGHACGHGDKSGLSNDDTIHVYTNAECTAT